MVINKPCKPYFKPEEQLLKDILIRFEKRIAPHFITLFSYYDPLSNIEFAYDPLNKNFACFCKDLIPYKNFELNYEQYKQLLKRMIEDVFKIEINEFAIYN